MTRVVLLHGAPGDRLSWAPLTEVMPSADAIDLLDHGARPAAPSATLDDLIDDTVANLAARPSPVILGGHSFGAWLAVHVAARVPEKVARLVLIAGLPEISGETAQALEGFALAFEAGVLTKDAAVGVAAERWLGPAPHDPDHVRRIRDLLASDGVDRFARQLHRVAKASAPVPALRVPTVVVHAEADQAVPIAMGEALAARLGATLERVPGANHFVHWVDPRGVARHFA